MAVIGIETDYAFEVSKTNAVCHLIFLRLMDLPRLDAAPLIAFIVTKETDYGTEADGRIPVKCGVDSADQRSNAQTGI